MPQGYLVWLKLNYTLKENEVTCRDSMIAPRWREQERAKLVSWQTRWVVGADFPAGERIWIVTPRHDYDAYAFPEFLVESSVLQNSPASSKSSSSTAAFKRALYLSPATLPRLLCLCAFPCCWIINIFFFFVKLLLCHFLTYTHARIIIIKGLQIKS